VTKVLRNLPKSRGGFRDRGEGERFRGRDD